jgi:signal transduction histidine kinase
VSKNPSLASFSALVQTNPEVNQLLRQFDQPNYKAGYGVVSSYNTSSGDVIGVANLIPLLGWTVIVETPTVSAYNAVWQGLGLTLLILVVTVGLALVYGRRFGQHLAKPLSLLTVAAQQIAAGNYTSQATELTATEQEVVELAQAFSQMNQALLGRFEQNNQLLQQTEGQAERLRVLNQISRAVSSTLDLASLYIILDNELAKIIKFDGLIILVGESEANYKVAYSNGRNVLAPQSLGKFLQDATAPLLDHEGNLKSAPLPTLLDQSLEDLDALLKTLLMVPIRRQEQTLGLIILATPQAVEYSSEQVGLIEAIGVQLAIAIQNGRIYQQLSKAYDELEHTQRALKQSARQSVLGEMASGIAHDFNNLVTTIMGCAQLLEYKLKTFNSFDDAEVKQMLATIIASSMDAAAIIRRISDYGRQRQNTALDVVDLNEVVRGAIDLTRPYWASTAQRTNSQIELDINLETSSCQVLANLSELREVLTNLIVNAVDAMPQGGKLSITTRLLPNDMSELTVQDSGVGMVEEVRRHIFEAFFSTKGERGSGLGLAVSYGIISQYNGRIEVDSELGRGSTFRVTLPRKQHSAINLAKAENYTQFRPKQQATILVVDDEPNVRYVLSTCLRKNGYEVEEAEDGQQALKLLTTFGKHFDLVLTDLGMPIMGGLELTSQVRQRKLIIPIIMVTGWSDAIDEERRQAIDIQAVVLKPFDLKKVLRIIDETLRLYGYLSV